MPPNPASPAQPTDALYDRLAAHIPDAAARALLRALLASVDEGGSEAVRALVRRQVQEILRDAG